MWTDVMTIEQNELLECTVEIVTAYIGNNTVPGDQLPVVIKLVHEILSKLSIDQAAEKVERTPAVPIRRSVQPDFIVCLEDGKQFKMLKRHLGRVYNLTPEEYRQKWSLPRDYPMVAPNYARIRSELAKQIGLGTKSKGRPRKPVS